MTTPSKTQDEMLICPEPSDEDFFSCPESVQNYLRELELRYHHKWKCPTPAPIGEEVSAAKTLAAIAQIKSDMAKSSDKWFVASKSHVNYLISAAQTPKVWGREELIKIIWGAAEKEDGFLSLGPAYIVDALISAGAVKVEEG